VSDRVVAASPRSSSEILIDRAVRAGALITLQVELTSRCPLKCEHCYNDDRVADRLRLERLIALLDEAAELGCLCLSLTGGEPCIHPHFQEFVRAARRRSYAVRVQTSGWTVDDRQADFLAGEAITGADISLHSGDPGVHDAVTGVPGSHARAVAAARALRARGVRVTFKTLVTTRTAGTYEAVGAVARELECGFIYDALVTPCESGACGPCAVRPDAAALRAHYELMMDGGEASWLEERRARTGGAPLDHAPCGAGRFGLHVASDGTAFPCVELRVPCGNVLDQSLAEIWRGSAALAPIRRLRWRDLPVCAVCALREYCDHCVGLALIEHGDLNGPVLEECRHAVIRRDLLREHGVIPCGETGLPPPLAAPAHPKQRSRPRSTR
jgi:radical SAM protein with 4Fe4S-binding SPASM domain